MRHFFRQFTKQDYIFFALCGVAYFLLIRQYLVAWDDLEYIYGANKQYISSVKDIILSQANAYMTWNGRFLVHSLVQLFVTIGGLELFYICSTLFFIVLLMSGRYLLGRINDSFNSNILFLVSLYLFMPLIGSTFFGDCAWTVNYMYSCAVYTFFLSVYYHIDKDHVLYNQAVNVVLFLFGIICGSWQESFSIGLSIALLIVHGYQLSKERSVKNQLSLFWLVIGFGAGACIGIFAPGNFCRLNSIGGSEHLSFSFASIASQLLNIFKSYPIILILLLVMTIASIIDSRNNSKWSFIIQHKLLIISIIIGLLFAIFVVSSGGRQFSMVILFAILIIIAFLQQYLSSLLQKGNKVIWIIGIILCISIYIPSLYYTYLLHKAEENLFMEVSQKPSSIAIDTEFETVDRCIIGASPIRKFINTYQTTNDIYDNLYFTKMLSGWITKGETDTICALILPEPQEKIVAHCTKSEQIGDSIYHAEKLNYFVLRLPDTIKPSSCYIKFQVQPKTIIQQLKYKILGDKCYTIPLQIPTIEMRNFKIENDVYYIFTHHNLYNASPKKMWYEIIYEY